MYSVLALSTHLNITPIPNPDSSSTDKSTIYTVLQRNPHREQHTPKRMALELRGKNVLFVNIVEPKIFLRLVAQVF